MNPTPDRFAEEPDLVRQIIDAEATGAPLPAGVAHWEDDDLGRPAATFSARIVPEDLPPDARPDYELCWVCLRTLHKQRRCWLNGHSPVPAQLCPACFSQEQTLPYVLSYWLGLPRQLRRYRLILHYGVDPVTHEDVDTALDTTRVYVGVDGEPLALSSTQRVATRVPYLGTPRCFWDLVRERGPGVL